MGYYGEIVVHWWFCWKSTYMSVGLTSRIYLGEEDLDLVQVADSRGKSLSSIHLVLHHPGVNMKGMNVSRLSVAFTPVPPVQDVIDNKLLVPIQNYSFCLRLSFGPYFLTLGSLREAIA